MRSISLWCNIHRLYVSVLISSHSFIVSPSLMFVLFIATSISFDPKCNHRNRPDTWEYYLSPLHYQRNWPISHSTRVPLGPTAELKAFHWCFSIWLERITRADTYIVNMCVCVCFCANILQFNCMLLRLHSGDVSSVPNAVSKWKKPPIQIAAHMNEVGKQTHSISRCNETEQEASRKKDVELNNSQQQKCSIYWSAVSCIHRYRTSKIYHFSFLEGKICYTRWKSRF